MISKLFLDLIMLLGCAIIFGLIVVVLGITWYAVKSIKEIGKSCTVAKTAKKEPSDATPTVINISGNEQSGKK